jgi:uncharacterized protein DUF4126
VLETLTGIGLATSAGLNAYIPLLMIAILDRYTTVITLPPGWDWLANGWMIGILTVLLIIEMVADKIPVVDHINDVIQTVVRPTAGGLAFGATSSATTLTVRDPGSFFSTHQWVPFVSGMIISFIVHSMKAVARPAVNLSTAGLGAPVASTAEDIFSTVMSFFAIVFPFLILFFVAGLIWTFFAVRRRMARRRAAKLAEKETRRQQTFYARDGDTLDLGR